MQILFTVHKHSLWISKYAVKSLKYVIPFQIKNYEYNKIYRKICSHCHNSQSASVLSTLKCNEWRCVSKEMFNGEKIFHIKKIPCWKVVLFQMNSLIHFMVKFRAETCFCTFLSCTKHFFEGHKIWCTKTIYSNTLKK